MSRPSTFPMGALRGNTVFSLNASPWDASDVRRLTQISQQAVAAASADVASLLPAEASAAAAAAVRQYSTFAHCGILLFPHAVEAAVRYFAELDLDPLPPVPSVLVRRRLCERYGLTTQTCEVYITKLRASPRPGTHHLLEVFLFPKTAKALESHIIHNEQKFEFENHIALQINQPDERLLEQLMVLLQSDAGLIWEGGGHNPHESTGGTTVLYFVRDQSVITTHRPMFERYELRCQGDFSSVVNRHPVNVAALTETYSAWTNSRHGRHLRS
ncbi:MAG: hypothetical protein ACREQV_01925 [Candidatus Binatia bacterium]